MHLPRALYYIFNKKCKPRCKVGDNMRIWKERGTFHRGYKEDFTTLHHNKSAENIPLQIYNLKDYSEEDMTL